MKKAIVFPTISSSTLLLNAADSDQAMQELLNDASDLLLEPLEDDDAVLETDSIYTPGMTRKERYETYKATMDERIQTARNSTVRVVLQKLTDFVLSHE